MASIKDRLEQLKAERGLTNRQLTELVNRAEPKEITVSESLISDILTVTNNKSGKDKRDKSRAVDYQKILKLARVLDVNTEYLCGWSDVRRGANDKEKPVAKAPGPKTIKDITINEMYSVIFSAMRDALNSDK